MRHLWQFWSGEDYDQESGLHHLEHALADIVFLLTYVKRDLGTDDRGPVAADTFDVDYTKKKA
jgi:hypothetical protein